MDFRGDLFILVIFSVVQKITGDDELPPFEVCPNAPKNLQTVHAVAYFNGCTDNSGVLFNRICTQGDGFSKDDLILELKVGADVRISKNNHYTCPSYNYKDCTCTFQYACLSKLMDEKKFIELGCCAWRDETTTFDGCVKEFGMDQALHDCMHGKTQYDPIKIAYDHAQEIVNKVDIELDTEPFIFFEQKYDFCTCHTATDWFKQSICKMFTKEKFEKLKICKDAF